MPTTRVVPPAADGPGLERTITLTDAVVAIAMTLLVLPLVDIAGALDARHLGTIVTDHSNLLLSFGISFLVIYVFWAAHGGALARISAARANPPALRPLNMGWLLVVAFLPFPTALAGRDLNTESAPFYIGTMLVLSALTSSIAVIADRVHRGTTGTSAGARGTWAWVTTAVFAACTLLALFNADLGMFALLLLVVVRLAEVRVLRRAAPTTRRAASNFRGKVP